MSTMSYDSKMVFRILTVCAPTKRVTLVTTNIKDVVVVPYIDQKRMYVLTNKILPHKMATLSFMSFRFKGEIY